MKSRLLLRMLLVMAAGFGLMAAATSLLSALQMKSGMVSEYKSRALALARSIADGNTDLLLSGSPGAIQAAIDLHQEMSDISYIVVVGVDGQIVAHTMVPVVPAEVRRLVDEMHANGEALLKPEIRSLLLPGLGEVLHVAQPVLGGRGGFVHIGMSTEPIRQATATAILRQQALTLVAFLCCLAIAFLFIRNLTGRLDRLAEYSRRVAAHDFSSSLDVNSDDEIGQLAESMRAMGGQIAGHVAQLEQSVAGATRELAGTVSSLSAIVGNMADGLLVAQEGRILRHNPALLRIFALADRDLTGQSCQEVFGPALCAALEPAAAASGLAPAAPRLVEMTLARKDLDPLPVEIAVSRVELATGPASVCILRDVSASKQLERDRKESRAVLERMVEERTRELSRANTQLKIEVAERRVVGNALRRAEAKFRGIFENAVEGIFQISPEGRYLSANPAMAAIFGFASPEELVQTLSERTPYLEPDRRESFLAIVEEKGQVQGFESQARRKSGRVIWISENARRVADSSGKTLHYEGFVEDITLRKEAESRLLHQAFHDPLTGLPNRLLFLDHLRMAMERARRRPEFRFAVLYMDLDRFKIINDSLGHDIGDRLLRHVSDALVACGRSTDTVARFGGDEFAILLEDFSAQRDAIRFCRRVLDEISKPMDLAGREVTTSGSIGVVLHTGGYERPEALLRDADTAMYHAKAQGKSRFKVFNKRMHHQAQELMELEIELRRAVAQDELSLAFQPIVDLRDDRLVGFETLVRWTRADGRQVTPAEFVPLAEETGIIYPLDHWVFAQACQLSAELSRSAGGDQGLVINVNMSAKHFRNPVLASQLEQVMRGCGVEPKSMALEITESVLLERMQSAREVAGRLRDLGLGLCIDDFGTGYSSLSYIQSFSVDSIKIDRGFVAGLDGGDADPGSEAIVRTIVTLGEGLGLKVVAEGVETEEQLRFLRELGCGYAQGYYFAEPLPREEALRLVASGAGRRWPGGFSG